MSDVPPTFVRERPSSMLRFGFKAPTFLYRGPFAGLFASRCVLLLTTTGRKSGLPRSTAVSFMPRDGKYIIFAGWGIRSNWYQNLLANPAATIQVGGQRIEVTAQPVQDPASRRDLMLQMRDRSSGCGPPPAIRPVLKALRMFDYDGEIALAVEQAEKLPVIELVPRAAG